MDLRKFFRYGILIPITILYKSIVDSDWKFSPQVKAMVIYFHLTPSSLSQIVS